MPIIDIKTMKEYKPLSLRKKLNAVDNGRFKPLLDKLSIEDACFDCHCFNEEARGAYKCYVSGSCIAATLSQNMQDYLICKIKDI